MQGVYRVRRGSEEVLESFVAGPGPMGWRYVGRAREPDSGREVYRVDHVVDAGWNLVRFRWTELDGAENSPSGRRRRRSVDDGSRYEHRELVAGISAVMSASPSSLMILDRLLASTTATETRTARLDRSLQLRTVVVSTPNGRLTPPMGGDSVREVQVTVGGQRSRGLIGRDLPLQVAGWFELVR
jgi:hypothetical protein